MKYIDADKLIEAIEEIKKAEYENCGGVNAKTGVLQEVQELITSFQQERSETPSGEEVMTMCNQILIDWVKEGKTPEEMEQREQAHIRFFELYDEYMQEQPEVDSEKLGEIARHLIAVKDHEKDMRLTDDEWLLLERIGYPERFNARKEK